MANKPEHRNVYKEVTDRIIEGLKGNRIPWNRPWLSMNPQNGEGREYQGINILLLLSTPYEDPRWYTFKKAHEIGGSVKKGSKATNIVYYKKYEKEIEEKGKDGTVEKKKVARFFLKSYPVFNAEQIDGIPPLEIKSHSVSPEDLANKVEPMMKRLYDTGLKFVESDAVVDSRAYYSPGTDTIKMPGLNLFETPEAYISTLFHEAGHATGHPGRLNRNIRNPFGHPDYAFEELVAEMISAYGCAEHGIPNDESRNIGYIQNWIEVLQKDEKALFRAASLAKGAMGWLAGKNLVEEDAATVHEEQGTEKEEVIQSRGLRR